MATDNSSSQTSPEGAPTVIGRASVVTGLDADTDAYPIIVRTRVVEEEVVDSSVSDRHLNKLYKVTAVVGIVAAAMGAAFIAGSISSRPNTPKAAPGVEVPVDDSAEPSLSPSSSASSKSKPSLSPSASPSRSAKKTAPVVITSTAPATPKANPGSAYEGKIIFGSNGERYYVDTNGKRHHIANLAVSNCISVRRGTGSPVSVADSVINSLQKGAEAFCPYGTGFVTEADSNGFVWVVFSDGTKRHAGGTCPNPDNNPKLTVWEVPTGETAGHVNVGDWFPSATACADIAG